MQKQRNAGGGSEQKQKRIDKVHICLYVWRVSYVRTSARPRSVVIGLLQVLLRLLAIEIGGRVLQHLAVILQGGFCDLPEDRVSVPAPEISAQDRTCALPERMPYPDNREPPLPSRAVQRPCRRASSAANYRRRWQALSWRDRMRPETRFGRISLSRCHVCVTERDVNVNSVTGSLVLYSRFLNSSSASCELAPGEFNLCQFLIQIIVAYRPARVRV